MSKPQLVAELVELLAPGDLVEQRRLRAHHAARPLQAVRESLLRQRAIASVSKAEIRRHCQLTGLAKLGR